MDDKTLAKLAVPAVVLLVAFLSYSSQLLCYGIDPGPLDRRRSLVFNVLVVCIWVSYARACATDPGRVPADWQPNEAEQASKGVAQSVIARQRYCRKCEAVKPPRSHHCRVCGRCIPKMDHHCPWTANCVSHFTFPHFMRFLFYATTAMCYLEYDLFLRANVIWQNRNLPSYLGPSLPRLVHLFILIVVNSLTLFLVSVIFLRTVWGLGGNVTTIESWEIERHTKLLRRARALGGYLDGPDGVRISIIRQEFPYDIGIWSNIVQGMGTANIFTWFWPFSANPRTSGLEFETNGFEDPRTSWPPPDPDRMPRLERSFNPEDAFVHQHAALSPEEEMVAFKERQQADFQQRAQHYDIKRRRPFHRRFDQDDETPLEDDYITDEEEEAHSGEEGWQDSGGNRLKDYGVDESVEFYDEDNIPIAELLRRRREGRGG
ncbi:Palmitoyltransferase [Exophiala sideris]|uniref:Palmitoyltransferase PFA4 n=1 Tax=Exophiala sideris TaxID=1016849 RepID=A0ABR0IXN9_9EURO|nr:Palmitoyltransferase [Exophiala sideris]KAK5026340.1 Palmitoyltransferase [Exophiala sideris]KAK5051131.1 Palmitoyltransferase [Exophiala sideris]KAK5177227.1 Palmitoyltransferase [Eurotiomycetes sp. CCFEE 6388]